MSDTTPASAARPSAATPLTILLCFIVALLEGMDIQSAGIAGPGIAAHFGLDKAQLGWVFSASILGLLPGAFAGGWLADRIGRKRVLTVAVALFGLFSLLTTQSWNLDSLLLARFMTGLGLGAALPNLIALTSESASNDRRATAVSLMYCGVPLGGALASLAGMFATPERWQLVFHLGGWAPLLVAPLLHLRLPESAAYQHQVDEGQRTGMAQGLFGNGQAVPTLLLWLSCFFTLMVVYLLLNWLPSLLIGQGFSRPQAGSVQLLLNLGMALGSVLAGVLLDRWRPALLVALIYGGILLTLAALGSFEGFAGMLLAGFAAGFFVLAAQLVLYALAPQFYPAGIRATGVGSAVAVGRLGSIGGPLLAGQMLASGSGTAGLMGLAAPGVLIAAAGIILLLRHRPTHE
ncbi:3-(3-hydroxy-phenyl)propionate transporter MhpT [Pseudomonas sp. BGr12]|uniref:3-(3-hydroxy-phenyl)propionate transporter MhpT n=1 Tax=unclassified Pseudomonas TaxID=196821 RepID=UPI0017867321|nr:MULTISPECIES: 3-(3-hydroxy-phenyl)propionate transporter MhpT [unclassified Pseudomonas]MBD9505038.1 3-(3-hydroxy-phenyl)propionate transporter MhpT [Pseudomonas sp. PDM17]MBD9578389.1 3-(3-hydroxy-phenyl)propionate transporter MhpT [Pseudomonas sp. PDM23]MBD9673588.1 3-(3-hydroxy-phenyl)propionate transporter MhpT [Pseudomonas sp. PDM21]MDL2431370.1 3-(3-hydroxy-phenyl)propionate transporter MhpT [Pseudomonas sp. BJa5]